MTYYLPPGIGNADENQPPLYGSDGVRVKTDYPARFLENIFIPVDWAFAFVVIKALKTPEGRKLIARLAEKWLDTEARMVVALAQSGAGNIITAWSHSHLIAMMLEHNYMIRSRGAKTLVDGMNWLTGVTALGELIGNISVPQSLAFDAGEGKEKMTIKGLGALAKLIK